MTVEFDSAQLSELEISRVCRDARSGRISDDDLWRLLRWHFSPPDSDPVGLPTETAAELRDRAEARMAAQPRRQRQRRRPAATAGLLLAAAGLGAALVVAASWIKAFL
jgi:hypothetical protein